MQFFNKKEEVMEVILTKKGKEIFSKGDFTPFYYSFHDSDIAYDNGSSEPQNSIVERINETPTLKSPTSIDQNESSDTKEMFLTCELGSKTIGDQYAPAWNIKFINSPLFQYVGTDKEHISDKKKYQVGFTSDICSDSSGQESIPQINILTHRTVSQNTGDVLSQDSDLLLSVEEFNSFNSDEFSEYEIECYLVESEGETFKRLSTEETKKYINIFFDKMADMQSWTNKKDIYGEQIEVDDSTC
jgi:hypothetical protein